MRDICIFHTKSSVPAGYYNKYCSIPEREMILDLCNWHPRFAQATNSHSYDNHLSRISIEMYYFLIKNVHTYYNLLNPLQCNEQNHFI